MNLTAMFQKARRQLRRQSARRGPQFTTWRDAADRGLVDAGAAPRDMVRAARGLEASLQAWVDRG